MKYIEFVVCRNTENEKQIKASLYEKGYYISKKMNAKGKGKEENGK